MNADKLVVVEYHNPERDVIESRPCWLREGSQHFLMIQEKIENPDLYTYTVIPRGLIRKITQLHVQEK